MNRVCFIGLLLILPVFFSEAYPYEIPAHLRLTLEAGKVWKDLPLEMGAKLGGGNKMDKICQADYDIGDDIYIGSGEEDLEENPLFCFTPEQTETNGGLNGFFEHFFDPDYPRLTPSNEEQRGYNCGELGEGYNLGLPAVIISACGDHFDSAYRTARAEWDKAIRLYHDGEIDEAYYWLGRVVHLLEDMALPAHVHLIPHPQGVVKKIPKTSFLAGPDLYEAFVTSKLVKMIAARSDIVGKEYDSDCLPNLCDFDWTRVHPNPSKLFKLFWYTAQKTQYFASRTTGAFGNSPLVGIGNNFYIDLTGKPHIFNPSLWEGEAEPISDPSELIGKKKVVNPKLREMADALVPHALKAVAGLYRLFWEETHPSPPPPPHPAVFVGLVSGNPGVPGDGVFAANEGINTCWPDDFELAPPIPVSDFNGNGFTLSIYPPLGHTTHEFQLQVNFSVSGMQVAECTVGFGAGFMSTPLFNGVEGIYIFYFPGLLEYLADYLRTNGNAICGNVQADELLIHSLNLSGSNGSVKTVDAVAIGEGKDNFPQP